MVFIHVDLTGWRFFSWRAIASQLYYVSGEARHIEWWLATRVPKYEVLIRFSYSKDVSFFPASGSEPTFNVYVRLRRTHMHLGHYRSPGIYRLIVGCEWIQFLVVRNEGVYFGTLV